MIATATNAASDTPAANVLDGSYESIWLSSANAGSKQSITIDLGIKQYVNKVKYLPRQYGGKDGTITGYKLYTSMDGTNYTLVSSGQWNDDKLEKTVNFDTVEAVFVKLEAIEAVGGVVSAAEINLYRDLSQPSPTAIPKNEMTVFSEKLPAGCGSS